MPGDSAVPRPKYSLAHLANARADPENSQTVMTSTAATPAWQITRRQAADGVRRASSATVRDVSEQRRLERHEHVLAEAGRRLIDTIE